MAQYKWKQIDSNLPAGGVRLSGSFAVDGTLEVSGTLHYNSQSLDAYISEQITTGSNNWNTIINKPDGIFSGSFTAGTNITIDQVGQDITISTSADVIPSGTVSGSSQINFLQISSIPDGLVSSSLQILPIATSSISNFDLEVSRSVASFGFGTGDVNDGDIADSIVTASLAGSNLILTKRNLTSFALNLGDVVPDTPTGSFVDSGSFDLAPAILTLYRPDGNLQIDLSGLGGSINDGDVTAVFAGGGLAGGGEGGDLVLSVNASPQYGTRVYNDYIAIATGSLYFTEGVIAAVYSASLNPLFRITGSAYSTTNDLQITGSLGILGTLNLTNTLSASDAFINDWGSISASLASNLAFTTDTSASLSLRISNQEAFSSSLDDIFATDAELNSVSASIKTFATDADTTLSASLAVDIATNAADITSVSSSAAADIATNVVNISSNTTRIITLESVTGSYATTASNQFVGNQDIDGDLTVTGRVTAQEFHSEFVSASIIYESGSTKFGDTQDDVHSFTGSLGVSGSISVFSVNAEASITASDVYISEWGSVSGSLQELSASAANAYNLTLQDVTNNGSLTTNQISISSSLYVSQSIVSKGEDVLDFAVAMAIALG